MKWTFPTKRLSSSVIQHLLLQRGIPQEKHPGFLNPTLDNLYPPSLLHDSKKAAKIILKAVEARKKIFVHGDYDVDGICATALMWDFLYKYLKADVEPYIPNRFDEGYGLSDESLGMILEKRGELVITVDCGVKNDELISKYKKKRMDFIITDHHVLHAGGLPKDALTVVHPQHPDSPYPFPEISGTTVAWKLCQAIVEAKGLYVDMDEYLDLVALATVCDVMPLKDENRILVAHGIEQMRKTKRKGLLALLRHASVNPADVQTYNLGFTIGPRLNAAGRLDSAMIALRLLATTSEDHADKLARDLQALNLERQKLTQDLLNKAEARISQLPIDQKLYFVHGEDWPEGILGLIAGRLTEKYNRPVLIGSHLDGILKGSARSTDKFHIADALKEASHLLDRHGGHAQAAGFTLASDKVDEFENLIKELASASISEDDLEKNIEIDLALKSDEVSMELAESLQKLQPFGFHNKTPVFAFLDSKILDKRLMGKENNHVRIYLDFDGTKLGAVDFNGVDRWNAISIGDNVDIAGNLDINEWNGQRKLQVKVRGVRVAEY